MSERNLNVVPSVAISRSMFGRKPRHKTSFNLGDIVPLYTDLMMPGQTKKLDLAAIIRMSQPIAPIMDDIVMEVFAFFTPYRLLWTHWKNFMGESDVAGYDTTEYTIPQCVWKPPYSNASLLPKCLGNYFGLPLDLGALKNTGIHVSALNARAYVAIYNRWFRNQNVEGVRPVTYGDLDGEGYANMGNLLAGECFKAYKKPDYFTTCLPYAQKGAPVALPLGTYAPVVTLSQEGVVGSPTSPVLAMKYRTLTGGVPGYDTQGAVLGLQQRGVVGNLNSNAGKVAIGGTTDDSGDTGSFEADDTFVAPSNLWADLSSATAATINDIRLAFATQKALEKDSLYGSRYWEQLYGHFGVKSPDATLQDPEYIGGTKFYINVDQVLSTTGFADDESSKLGVPGANSVTGFHGSLFTYSTCEWGCLMIVGVARQKTHTYSNSLNKLWSLKRRFDFYLPVFANLGNQAVTKKELTCNAVNADTEADLDAVFGYQEAWAEYRYKPSIVSGILNPNLSSSLDYWTLADEDPTDEVTLSRSFLEETRENISRALVTGSSGPDFIADFMFIETNVDPMPLRSIPGWVDHH